MQNLFAPHFVRLTLCSCALIFAACGGKGEPASTPSPAAPAAAVPASTAAPENLEAESALSIKRGVITLTAQSRSFRLCGSNVDLTLNDQLDGALDRAYTDLGGKPMYAEVYGDRGDAEPGNNASNSFNVEELLFASGANVAAACNTTLGKYELLARGNEPTWSVEVKQDTLTFRQTSAPTQIDFSSSETSDAEGSVTYRAGVDRHVLELTITQRACRDSMSGEYYAYSATARLNKQAFNGCARVGE
ncbi:MAG TPA: hypothetical protein VK629_08370 [Steroidobacteraceae bacterium]|nr:hypothetical protein [Steroidobacteraceae bacterium]